MSVFIILGLILVIGAGFFIYHSSQKTISTPTAIEETGAIQNFVQACLERSAHESIVYVLKEGGYYENFSKSIYLMSMRPIVAAYLIENASEIPDKSVVENSLSEYVNDALLVCTENFTQFKAQGIEIQESAPEINVTIMNNEIFFDLAYKLKIKKQDATAELEKFNTKQQAEITDMLKFAGDFIDAQKQEMPYFQISTLIDLCDQSNLAFEWEHTESAEIITLVKEDSIFKEPLKLKFAVEYNASQAVE